ncbi:hypothetical protein, conserved [Entamoeba dispar SAW760]|uniref:Leucine rich repeat containing protein BspA family protein n=1 Tax=Entamoeba dispar (strain ATCC PRA-260 / SAW760) TaxID=370354 RepID=B0E7Q2_ENTDS|nr:uncharacterized protein EDI_014560 [Entamoeba dispar SAW760]EDR29446.1 hypothetical protein, conserved [Entamoeba dispar SAW760]|eukprot:EDR29446.1 hypothetical protein, conserved [Entamoeba dispar SAW760]
MKPRMVTMIIDIEYDDMDVYLYDGNEYERVDKMKYLKEEEKKIIEEIISNDKKNVKIRKENIKGVEMMIKPESKLSIIFNNIKKEVEKKGEIERTIIFIPNGTSQGNERRIENSTKLGRLNNVQIIRKYHIIERILSEEYNIETPILIIENTEITYGNIKKEKDKIKIRIINTIRTNNIIEENKEINRITTEEKEEKGIIINNKIKQENKINTKRWRYKEINEEPYIKTIIEMIKKEEEYSEYSVEREMIINIKRILYNNKINKGIIGKRRIGYNEIMITSKYFNDIKDFINLEIGIKRFRGNIERFHFNPIPLNEYSRKFFPNIETFHIYNKKDKIFNDGRIFTYVIWYPVSYLTYLKEKGTGNIYKNIEYTQKDINLFGNTIPSEVKSLGDQCFYTCKSLKSINIPSSVNKIGNNCFYECTSLTSINIPSTISKIGNYCFDGCSSLTSINIPSSIKEIGYKCFYGCSSLKSIDIKNIQYTSEDKIFVGDKKMVSIDIGNLMKINKNKIERMDVNKFLIPTTVSDIKSQCFSECSTLRSINLPSSIIEIGNYCFCGCSSLTSINIPSSISKIGYECFDRCLSLKELTIQNIKFISKERIFMNEPVLFSIKIPESIKKINGGIIKCEDINDFRIPTMITKLDDNCFSECWSLTSINIPTSITKLGNECFYRCKSLTSVTIPTTISELRDNCFDECKELMSINIPSTIEEIGNYCFYGCSSLKSINIPSSITSFGNSCFYKSGCEKSLREITRIPKNCFE